jgi:hypothetical protein
MLVSLATLHHGPPSIQDWPANGAKRFASLEISLSRQANLDSCKVFKDERAKQRCSALVRADPPGRITLDDATMSVIFS